MTSQEYKGLLAKRERAFDIVIDEFLSGKLEEKIDQHGKCEYIFKKLGQNIVSDPRECEREKGHPGAHMFGVKK